MISKKNLSDSLSGVLRKETCVPSTDFLCKFREREQVWRRSDASTNVHSELSLLEQLSRKSNAGEFLGKTKRLFSRKNERELICTLHVSRVIDGVICLSDQGPRVDREWKVWRM